MAFPAKYEGGPCPANCGNRLHAGDMIHYSLKYSAFVHEGCAPPEPAPPIYDVKCIVCGREKPCRCDE